jgi:hypothetical protein
MSMRGKIISKEYDSMVFVHDNKGKQFACYAKDLKNFKDGETLNEDQKDRCLDTSLVLGDSW